MMKIWLVKKAENVELRIREGERDVGKETDSREVS